MVKEIKLEKFAGPLDLLLQLIEQEKMDITEIALSKITEQYFAYLEKMDVSQAEELSDFLLIATRLVYLKSKSLLPYLYPEEDEGPNLADQLKLYKQYLEASHKINELWMTPKLAYGRIEPPVKAPTFTAPLNAQIADLHSTFLNLLKRLKPVNPLPQISIDRTISIKNKITSIYETLKKIKKLTFSQVLENAENRTEVIVSFLAILELAKDKFIFIKQTDNFGEMELKKL